MQTIQVNLGSGNKLPLGWVNIDNSWHARICRYPWLKRLLLFFHVIPRSYKAIDWQGEVLFYDILRGLPFRDNTVSVIYASHILEHLFFESAKVVLMDAHRVLKPGGILRVIVPDLDSIIDAYQKRRESGADMAEANQIFIRSLGMWPAQIPRVPWWIRWFRGRYDKNLHRWVYNHHQLVDLLRHSGFVDICTKEAFDSRIADIEAIENQQRLEGALCLEALKPRVS